ASAMGKVRTDGALPAGTVILKVIAGDMAKPVATEVTLVVSGVARVARTDAEGRATFQGVAIGGQAQVKITGEDEKEITSDQFVIPDAGGTRLFLSTTPLEASPMGMGMGGQPGMPE